MSRQRVFAAIYIPDRDGFSVDMEKVRRIERLAGLPVIRRWDETIRHPDFELDESVLDSLPREQREEVVDLINTAVCS